jgi:hypothetical protein
MGHIPKSTCILPAPFLTGSEHRESKDLSQLLRDHGLLEFLGRGDYRLT